MGAGLAQTIRERKRLFWDSADYLRDIRILETRPASFVDLLPLEARPQKSVKHAMK